jgi:hypothetical protein
MEVSGQLPIPDSILLEESPGYLLSRKRAGHVETRNRYGTETNVHTIRSTQHTLQRKKLNHDITFKKARRETYINN